MCFIHIKHPVIITIIHTSIPDYYTYNSQPTCKKIYVGSLTTYKDVSQYDIAKLNVYFPLEETILLASHNGGPQRIVLKYTDGASEST